MPDRRRTFAAACASSGGSNLVMCTSLLARPLSLGGIRGRDARAIGLTL